MCISQHPDLHKPCLTNTKAHSRLHEFVLEKLNSTNSGKQSGISSHELAYMVVKVVPWYGMMAKGAAERREHPRPALDHVPSVPLVASRELCPGL